MIDEKLYRTAKRIIDIDPYGAADADETPESVSREILNDPLYIISFLLDVIDELQA